MLRAVDCIVDGVRLSVPQATEWQRIRNEIDAAMIFAGLDFINEHFLIQWHQEN
jgi:hypothetical protein